MPTPSPKQGPLRSSLSDDPDMRPLVEEFVAEMGERVTSLDRSFRNGQAEDLKRLAHQLKGASAGYGFDRLGQAAGALEESLQRLGALSGDLARVRREFEDLVDLCRRASV